MGILATLEAQPPQTNKLALGEFFKLARTIALHRGDMLAAAAYAKANRATERVVSLLQRAAVSPGSLTSWADIASEYAVLSEAFSASLRHVGVFDRALPFMIPSPLRSRAVVGEGVVKPITKLDFSAANNLVDPKKASAI